MDYDPEFYTQDREDGCSGAGTPLEYRIIFVGTGKRMLIGLREDVSLHLHAVLSDYRRSSKVGGDVKDGNERTLDTEQQLVQRFMAKSPQTRLKGS